MAEIIISEIILEGDEGQHRLIAEYHDYLMDKVRAFSLTSEAANLYLMLVIFCAAEGRAYGVFPMHVNSIPTICGLTGEQSSLLLRELFQAGMVKINGPDFVTLPEMLRRKGVPANRN